MPCVHVTGWRYGMQKVSTTQVLRARLGLGLAEGKGITDAILDGKELWLEVESAAAEELAAALHALGVDATAEADASTANA
jgi:ribosomal protein L7/L12